MCFLRNRVSRHYINGIYGHRKSYLISAMRVRQLLRWPFLFLYRQGRRLQSLSTKEVILGTPAEGVPLFFMSRTLNMVWDQKQNMYVYRQHKSVRYRLNRLRAMLILKFQTGSLFLLNCIKKPLLIVLLTIALVVVLIGKVGYFFGRYVKRKWVPRLLAWL